MKKLLITLAFMLTLGAIQAQEVKKENKFFMEAKVGMETFNNYSTVSIFADGTPRYSGPSTELNFGYRSSEDFAFELSFFGSGMFTSDIANNEYFYNNGIMLGFREYFSMSERSEFYYGVRVGMIRGCNTLTYQDNDYKITRNGIKAQFTAGYNYYLSQKNYIGVSVNFPTYGALMSANDIPTELSSFTPNPKEVISGFGINVSWGIKF